jgi:hypothetical protein
MWVALFSSISLTFVPMVADAQQRSHPDAGSTPATRARAWVGCWTLQATQSGKVIEADTVRLYDAVLPERDQRTWYVGASVPPPPPKVFTGTIRWAVSQHGDSVEIRVEGLGGTIWRVARHAGSLVGEAYHTFDAIPGEQHRGRATGRRVKC